MVQEQEAARARFSQQQAEVEANTAVIKARGEAESINLRGKALRENPACWSCNRRTLGRHHPARRRARRHRGQHDAAAGRLWHRGPTRGEGDRQMNPRKFDGASDGEFNPRSLFRWIGAAILVFVAILLVASGTYVVQPGTRGVAVTLGNVDPVFKREDSGSSNRSSPPFMPCRSASKPRPCRPNAIRPICSSEDGGSCIVPRARTLGRQDLPGLRGRTLRYAHRPRVQEALKEVAATQSAEQIVKNREEVKTKALELARRKIGPNFLEVVDLVIYHLASLPNWAPPSR